MILAVVLALLGASAVHAQTPTPTSPIVPTRPYEGEVTPTPRIWCPPSPTPPRGFATPIYPTAVFTTTRVPTATPTGTPTPTPTPYPGGYRVLEIPIGLEWDYVADRTTLEDWVTVLSFEVITGTVVAFGLELAAEFNYQGNIISELYLMKPATAPLYQWRFYYEFYDHPNTINQVSFHYDHAALGYYYPDANVAVTDFENNFLFPRPGIDKHWQLEYSWVIFSANEGGAIKVRIWMDTGFPPRVGRFKGKVYTAWLVYTGNLFYQVPPAPGGCWGNNCAARTPTPTPNVTPTPTPFLTPAPTPTPWGCIELPPDVTPRVRINPRGTCVTLIPATDVLGVQIPDVTVCIQDVEITVGYLFGQDITAWTVRAGLILIAFTLWRILVRR